MSNTIKLKRSSTASAVPSTLEAGELAFNTADFKLYAKDSNGNIRRVNGDGIEMPASVNIYGNTLWLDFNNGNYFYVLLNANVSTVSFSNINATFQSFVLEITANGTTRSITWPSSVKWAGGTAPTLTSTNGKKDVFTFTTRDGGTTWLAFVSGQNF